MTPGFQDSPEAGWGSEIGVELVCGQPCRVYRQRPRNLGGLLADTAEFSDQIHLVQGERRLTFAELTVGAAAAEGRLAACGVRPGDRVVLLARNSIEWVACLWGVWRLGAVAVIGNAAWSAQQCADALELVGATVVAADERSLPLLPNGAPALALETITADAPAAPSRSAGPLTTEDDPAVLIFTSGTTGAPKAATLSHRSVIANLQGLLVHARRLPGARTARSGPAVTLMSVPLFHIGGLQQVLTAALTGGRLVFGVGRFEPEQILETMEREQVSAWAAVPTMVGRVVEAVLAPGGSTRDLSALRAVTMGGAPVTPRLREQVRLAFPAVTRGAGVSYGLTEAGGVVAAGVGAELADRPGTVGRLMPLVDVEIKEPDAAGIGEILVRSPAVMSGYWGFTAGPWSAPGGWLHTGDLGRLDGTDYLYVTGRAKDIVIRGGENVSCPRVEEAIAAHPGVLEVAVIGVPDADLGEQVAAVVVPRAGAEIDEIALTDSLAGVLAAFEIPSRWWIRAEPLPQNAAGKVVKSDLAELWPSLRIS